MHPSRTVGAGACCDLENHTPAGRVEKSPRERLHLVGRDGTAELTAIAAAEAASYYGTPLASWGH